MQIIEQLKKRLTTAVQNQLSASDAGVSHSYSNVDGLVQLNLRKIIWFGLTLVFLVALFLRVDNYGFWQDNPQQFFVDDEPILLNVDGYYYLDLARDLVSDTYHRIDEHRTVPNGQPRPAPVPLLSIVTSAIHQFTGWSLAGIAIFLPTLLGALIVFPVYGLGVQYGGRVMGFVAALIAAASPHFVQRTTLGWYDTDGLVVVFPLAIAWALLRFAESPVAIRMRYLALAIVMQILFLWWWDFGIAPVLAAFFIPLGVVILFYEHNRSFRMQLLTGSTIAFILIAVLKPETLGSFINQFNYLYQLEESTFPTAGGNVVEQTGIGLNIIARETMHGWLGFVMGVGGFIMLAFRQKKRLLFLTFPVVVGCLSLTAARFLIFLAPVLGLGVGMLCQGIWNLRYRVGWAIPVSGLVFLLASWPIIANFDRDNSTIPLRQAYQVQAFKAMEKLLPADATIWGDWSHGYPIAYYSRRGTYADGSFRSGRLIFTLSLPMAAASPRMAANWINFYSQRGEQGLDEIKRRFGGDWISAMDFMKQSFASGPGQTIELLRGLNTFDTDQQRDWLEYLFPSMRQPVYLFLDYDKMRTPWFRFGLWDPARGEGPDFIHEVLLGLQRDQNSVQNYQFQFNTDTGTARFRGSEVPLKRSLVHGRGVRDLAEQGLTLEYFEAQRWGVLFDDNAANSVARKLYSRRLHNSQWFSVVQDSLPYFGVWKVRPDNLSGLDFAN